MRCNCLPFVEFSKAGFTEHIMQAHGMTLEDWHQHWRRGGGPLPSNPIVLGDMPQLDAAMRLKLHANLEACQVQLNVAGLSATLFKCKLCGEFATCEYEAAGPQGTKKEWFCGRHGPGASGVRTFE